MNGSEKQLDYYQYVLYYIVLYMCCAIKQFVFVDIFIGTGTILYTLLSFIIEIIIWLIPIYLIIRYYLEENPIEYLYLSKSSLMRMNYGAALGCLFLLFNIAKLFFTQQYKMYVFSISFNELLNGIFLATIVEEVVFRGFILKGLSKKMVFWKANLITSIAFLIMHYPLWIYNSNNVGIIIQVEVVLVSFAVGYLYEYSRSLWSTIAFHFIYSFTLTVINRRI